MSRGVGEIGIVSGHSESVAVLAALLTALGDVWFVFLFLGTLDWFGPTLPGPVSLSRRQAAFVIALAFGGLATTTMLKELFRLPRPPGAAQPAGAGVVPEGALPLFAEIGAATGYGFPSGHSVSAVVVYGGLALLIGTRRGYGVAALLCVLIPVSRVVLEVHYVVDIVAGLTLGAAYLAIVYRLCGRGSIPSRALSVALAAALAGAAIGYTTETMFALGGALGGRMAWGIVGSAVLEEPTTRAGGTAGASIGLAFGGLFAFVNALDPDPYVSFIGMFVLMWGVFAAPLAGEALARRL